MNTARTGALRRRLALEEPLRSDDGGGGGDIAWHKVADVWAAIEPRGGSERFAAGRQTSSVSHDIVLRWRPGIMPEMRFRLGERVFHILAVLEPDDRRRRLRALCEERIGA